MSHIDEEMGLRLKVARKAAGYKTALDFATAIHLPKSTYSQHETGKRSLTAEQILFYAEQLAIAPNWLLTGIGHPCPTANNKSQRKNIIEQAITALQQENALPIVRHAQLDVDDTAAVTNLALLSNIIIAAIETLTTHRLTINANELVKFCIDVYNNIEVLTIPQSEKDKIIQLSIQSMLRGNQVIAKKVVNL